MRCNVQEIENKINNEKKKLSIFSKNEIESNNNTNCDDSTINKLAAENSQEKTPKDETHLEPNSLTQGRSPSPLLKLYLNQSTKKSPHPGVSDLSSIEGQINRTVVFDNSRTLQSTDKIEGGGILKDLIEIKEGKNVLEIDTEMKVEMRDGEREEDKMEKNGIVMASLQCSQLIPLVTPSSPSSSSSFSPLLSTHPLSSSPSSSSSLSRNLESRTVLVPLRSSLVNEVKTNQIEINTDFLKNVP